MIRDDGVVKLTDFGIAQILDAQRMTVTGQLLGSPAYMSPEHVEGKPLDFRTDVFSVGILLYQLTTGELPFKGRNPHEILKRIAECKFIDPRQANPRIGNQPRIDVADDREKVRVNWRVPDSVVRLGGGLPNLLQLGSRYALASNVTVQGRLLCGARELHDDGPHFLREVGMTNHGDSKIGI